MLPRRVRVCVDFLQGLDQDVGVNLKRLQAGVSKHGLDVTNVRSVLQHEGGERVAEQVATAGHLGAYGGGYFRFGRARAGGPL